MLDYSRPISMFSVECLGLNEMKFAAEKNFILAPLIIIYPKMPKCRDWVLVLMFSLKFNI